MNNEHATVYGWVQAMVVLCKGQAIFPNGSSTPATLGICSFGQETEVPNFKVAAIRTCLTSSFALFARSGPVTHSKIQIFIEKVFVG